MAGTKGKMIGIREDDLCAEFFERFITQALYGGLRAHGQEKWRLDGAVGRGQAATARAGGIGPRYFKRKIHLPSVSGEDEGPADAARHIGGPHAEGNGECLGAFQFFGVHRGKPDGQEN